MGSQVYTAKLIQWQLLLQVLYPSVFTPSIERGGEESNQAKHEREKENEARGTSCKDSVGGSLFLLRERTLLSSHQRGWLSLIETQSNQRPAGLWPKTRYRRPAFRFVLPRRAACTCPRSDDWIR